MVIKDRKNVISQLKHNAKHRPSVYLNNCMHHLVMGNYHQLKVGHNEYIRSCLSLVILSTRNGSFVKINTEIRGGVGRYNTVGKICYITDSYNASSKEASPILQHTG